MAPPWLEDVDVQFRVGPWLVDTSLNIISRNGTTVHLEPKMMEVLVCLATHAGEAVSKEKLLEAVWPGTFVTEDALKRCVSHLRRVLEDDAREPHIIQTIPKRGYRLLAPVEPVDGTKEFSALVGPVPVHRASHLSARTLSAAAAVAAVTLLSVLLVGVKRIRSTSASGVPPIHSLAVLPLQNLSADPAQEYFSDGMTDALITDLAQVGSVKVISRTSTLQYKQTKQSLPEIARELNVDAIVEGTVQRSGNRVRITAQLIHGTSDKHLWASSYERDLGDIFALEQEVTQDIADQVRARITPEKRNLPVQPRPVNVAALEAYMQGNFHLRMSAGRRDNELRKAGTYFQHAINIDPTFVPAYIGMAEAHHDLLWPSSDDFGIMQASAEKALELAPTSSDAHQAVGTMKWEAWDWAGAEKEYTRAIELNFNSANAHESLGNILDVQGELDEGWKEEETAQDLDPNEDHLSWALFRRGEYDRAIALAQRVIESHSEDASTLWLVSESYARKGLYAESLREWSKSATVSGFPDAAERVLRAFAKSGYQSALRQEATETERAIAEKQGYFPGILADIYTTLGDKDRAFYWLEQACEHHYQAISDPLVQWAKIDPGFAPLRSDPRFKDVLRCMGLSP